MLNKTTNRYAFELTDHLGNVRAVVAKNASTSAADVLSYTDYYPHGGVLPGRNFVSSPSYKLGYQGQEKDPETNFSNFELRQMDARLGRWFNPDPMGQYFSPYLAMGNNPVSQIDPTGGWSDPDQLAYENDLRFDYGSDSWFNGEFGQDYQVGGSFGGSHTASGGFYSNTEMSYDASSLYYKNHHVEGKTGYATATASPTYYDPDLKGLTQQTGYTWTSTFGESYWDVAFKERIRQTGGNVAYYMHGVVNGFYDAGEAAVLFGARDIFYAKTWKNMGNMLKTMSFLGIADGSQQQLASGILKQVSEADAYDVGNFSGQVGFAIVADKGLGAIGEIGAVVEGTAVIGEVNVAKTGIAKSKALGSAMEEALGMSKSKTAINVNGKTRFPDRLGNGLLEESKNVKHLNLTKQLRDYLKYSQDNGLDFMLHTRPSTTFSKPLQRLIDQKIILHNPVQGF